MSLSRWGTRLKDGPEIRKPAFITSRTQHTASHPSRDAADTFYVSEDLALRSQTSTVAFTLAAAEAAAANNSARTRLPPRHAGSDSQPDVLSIGRDSTSIAQHHACRPERHVAKVCREYVRPHLQTRFAHPTSRSPNPPQRSISVVRLQRSGMPGVQVLGLDRVGRQWDGSSNVLETVESTRKRFRFASVGHRPQWPV